MNVIHFIKKKRKREGISLEEKGERKKTGGKASKLSASLNWVFY